MGWKLKIILKDKVMKWSKLFMSAVLLNVGMACSDGDSHGNGDEILDMSGVENKYLYYNKWLNNKDAYTTEGLVDVVRFGSDGKLWNVDFGGLNETLLGTWAEDATENSLRIRYQDGTYETWHVLNWKNGVFTVMVNEGKREYLSEDNKATNYLKGITGDAFLLTEITQANSKTTLRVLLEGENTVNVKEAKVILSEDRFMGLKYTGNRTMMEKEEIDAAALGLPGAARDVIFYVSNKNVEFKFADHIYAEGLGNKNYSAFDLRGSNTSNELNVKWNNPYSNENAYCQIEVWNEKGDEAYFVSDYLSGTTHSLKIDNTTKCREGYTNTIRSLINKGVGTKFTIRLSIVLLEPGIDVNSKCSYINRQAVTNVTVLQVWNN